LFALLRLCGWPSIDPIAVAEMTGIHWPATAGNLPGGFILFIIRAEISLNQDEACSQQNAQPAATGC
jgi:hypothetical protein